MNRSELFAYLAGIIDGEGTITITVQPYHRRKTIQYRPRISVANTNFLLMEFLKKEFGGAVSAQPIGKIGHKVPYRWQVLSARALREILDGTLPFLVVKKPQAILLSSYLDLRGTKKGRGRSAPYSDEERWIHLAIRKLNSRGADDEN